MLLLGEKKPRNNSFDYTHNHQRKTEECSEEDRGSVETSSVFKFNKNFVQAEPISLFFTYE